MKPHSAIDIHLQQQLQERRDNNALRRLPDVQRGIDFCSNDYLGFARQAFAPGSWTSYGATGSRLISGNHETYNILEQQLADFHQAEAALVFGSGYQANLGLLSCIATRQDTILYDELAHASIRDAVRLSPSRSFAFRHNDVAHLQQKLEQASGRIWVVVESVYSMDGDEAPLAALQACCEAYNAALIVDEAHAVGVFGEQGRGLVAELGLSDRIWARVVTFGKAIGSHGAAVLGSGLLRDFLINFSRPFIYTTGLPPDSLHRISQAYRHLQENTILPVLQQRIRQFRDKIPEQIQAIPSRSAIHCLLVPGNDAVKAAANSLQSAGFDIRPILHPTVPAGSERLRICLHSFNTETEVEQLCMTLQNVVPTNHDTPDK